MVPGAVGVCAPDGADVPALAVPPAADPPAGVCEDVCSLEALPPPDAEPDSPEAADGDGSGFGLIPIREDALSPAAAPTVVPSLSIPAATPDVRPPAAPSAMTFPIEFCRSACFPRSAPACSR